MAWGTSTPRVGAMVQPTGTQLFLVERSNIWVSFGHKLSRKPNFSAHRGCPRSVLCSAIAFSTILASVPGEPSRDVCLFTVLHIGSGVHKPSEYVSSKPAATVKRDDSATTSSDIIIITVTVGVSILMPILFLQGSGLVGARISPCCLQQQRMRLSSLYQRCVAFFFLSS